MDQPEFSDTPEFSITTANLNGSVIISVAGELDRATAPEMEEVLVTCDGNRPVIVDVTALTFIDSGGLHVLLKKRDGGRPAALVVEANSHISRVFDIVNAGKTMLLCHDLETAVNSSGQTDG